MTPSKMTPQELKKWRESMGWSIEFCARKLGISKSAYQNYERGIRVDKGIRGTPVKIPSLIAWACKKMQEATRMEE